MTGKSLLRLNGKFSSFVYFLIQNIFKIHIRLHIIGLREIDTLEYQGRDEIFRPVTNLRNSVIYTQLIGMVG